MYMHIAKYLQPIGIAKNTHAKFMVYTYSAFPPCLYANFDITLEI